VESCVIDNAEEQRYELRLDGELAGWIDYRRAGETVALTHAEVRPELRNQGHAETMTREALADLKERGLKADRSARSSSRTSGGTRTRSSPRAPRAPHARRSESMSWAIIWRHRRAAAGYAS
jgi:hypothetical protein